MSIATDLERYMLSLVNAERAEHGLDPLVLEQNLNVSADDHSQWMSDADSFGHTGVSGSAPHDRMVTAGVDFSGSWRATENVAAMSVQGADSYTDEVDHLHEGLMNSPGHRANILDANVDYIGIGIAFGPLTYGSGSYQSVLITQNFIATGGIVDLDIEGDTSAESFTTTGGDDNIAAGRGNDTINAGNGNDNIWGDGGDDSIVGGAGHDTLRGGRENDHIEGGSGNDSIVGQRNGDTLTGDDGADTLKGGGGSDHLSGGAGDDFLKGGTYQDTVLGGAGDDTITGNRHDDYLDGGAGHDTINAGGDNDTLIGGSGNDTMKGGAGWDVFIFDTGHDADEITDFNITQDTLEISTALAGGQSAAQIVSGASVTADGVLIDFGGGDTILLDGLASTAGLDGAIDII